MKLVVVALILLIPCLASASQLDINNLITATSSGSIKSPLLSRGQSFFMGESGTLDKIVLEVADIDSNSLGTSLGLFGYSNNELVKISDSYLVLENGTDLRRYEYSFSTPVIEKGRSLAFLLSGENIRVGTTSVDLLNSEPLQFQFGQLYLGRSEIVFATYITPIPEPSSLAMAGLACIAFTMRLKKPH